MRRALPLLLLVACGGPDAAIPPALPPIIPAPSATLYARLGGKELLDALAAELLGALATEPATAARLQTGDPDDRRLRLAEALCAGAGGPCTPRPRPIEAVVPLTEAEEEAVVDGLHRSLERFRIGEREKSQLRAPAEAALRDALGA